MWRAGRKITMAETICKQFLPLHDRNTKISSVERATNGQTHLWSRAIISMFKMYIYLHWKKYRRH